MWLLAGCPYAAVPPAPLRRRARAPGSSPLGPQRSRLGREGAWSVDLEHRGLACVREEEAPCEYWLIQGARAPATPLTYPPAAV